MLLVLKTTLIYLLSNALLRGPDVKAPISYDTAFFDNHFFNCIELREVVILSIKLSRIRGYFCGEIFRKDDVLFGSFFHLDAGFVSFVRIQLCDF